MDDKNLGFNAHPREWNTQELYNYCIQYGLIDKYSLIEEWQEKPNDLRRLVIEEAIKSYE